MNHRSRLRLCCLLGAGGLLQMGCKDTNADRNDRGTDAANGSPCHQSSVSRVAVTRVTDHLGGGRELTVRLQFDGENASESPLDLASCLEVRDPAGGPTEHRIVRRPVTKAETALLVDPGATAGDNELARQLVKSFLAHWPAQDRIAVFRWGELVTQVATFSSDRAFTDERVGAGLPPTAGGPLLPAVDAFAAVATDLGGAGGLAEDVLRLLVIVSPRALPMVGPEAVNAATPHLLAWVGPPKATAAQAAIPRGFRYEFVATNLGSTVVALSRRVAEHKANAHYGIGYCGPRLAHDVQVHFQSAPTAAPVALGSVLQENDNGPCQSMAMAQGTRPHPRKIEFILTDAQQKLAEEFYALGRKDNFALSVRISPGHLPMPAAASFRGSSSYGCVRRNYNLNLGARAPRFLMPGSSANKFHLISMCLDRLYLRNYIALRLSAEEGLFPVPFDYVELVVGGVTRGVYLLVEDVSDALRQKLSRVSTVIRRHLGPGGTATELKWATLGQEAALAGYAALLAKTDGLSGPALESALRARLNLPAYLRWIGLMTLLGSGDYIDEVYFYATQTTAGDGTPTEHYSVTAWDQDDLFSACHFSGRQAIHDPFGLLYCAEAELDKRIFLDPHLYARYVEVLATLLDQLSVERFAQVVTGATGRLLTYFQDDAIRGAMIEIPYLTLQPTSSFEVVRSLLQSETELLVTQFAESRAALLSRIAAFRATR